MASMATAISGTGSAASAAQRRYPPINSADSAKSFFDLIRAGKFEDTDAEYGAFSVAREWPVVIEELVNPCAVYSFEGQTVAEKQMEMLLEETGNPDRFRMVRQIALVLYDHNIDTPYSRITEAIAVKKLGEDENADVYLLNLSEQDGIQKFIQTLVTIYHGRQTLYELFDALDSEIMKFQSDDAGPTELPDHDSELSEAGLRAPDNSPAETGPLAVSPEAGAVNEPTGLDNPV